MKVKAWLSANQGKYGIGIHKSKVYVERVKDKDKWFTMNNIKSIGTEIYEWMWNYQWTKCVFLSSQFKNPSVLLFTNLFQACKYTLYFKCKGAWCLDVHVYLSPNSILMYEYMQVINRICLLLCFLMLSCHSFFTSLVCRYRYKRTTST